MSPAPRTQLTARRHSVVNGRPSLAAYVLVIAVCVPFAYPLFWMVLGAGRTDADFFDSLWTLPRGYQWQNYVDAWTVGHIGAYTLNSIIVTLATIVGVSVLGFPLAYAIARIRFRGHRAVVALFAITLFVPIQIFVVSLFDLEASLGIIDTYWAMILPYVAANLPFTVVFLTAYLRAIPRELDEAAALDGANRFTIMTRVLLPLSLPAFATVVVFTFLSVWNEFIIALTVTQSESVRTLPLGLLNFSQQFGQRNYPQLFAALTLSAIPVFVVFVLAQRQFLRGLTSGAVRM